MNEMNDVKPAAGGCMAFAIVPVLLGAAMALSACGGGGGGAVAHLRDRAAAV